MERDEKIQLLLDMQEHPEQFSEQALQTMLDDPEVRKLMEATTQLKQAMLSDENDVNNVDAEWQRFAQTHLTEQKPERSWLKIAATFIGILMMSGIAFAAIHIIRNFSNAGIEPQKTIQETTIANPHQLPADTIKTDTIPSKVVRYDEATLEQILTDMADYYGLSLIWKSEDAKTLRLFYIWNKQQSAVEAIRSMNSFERIRLELSDSILTADLQTSSPKQ
ncbi:hypothetical protein [Xylanibacter ruminicola]|uniref:Protein FecR C-terminal domain-containing protein n=1 Tax=Xylanibacter ruminicola TaxID=839 RepID=A0A1M6UPI1_XYLRU|nr:hypothetical protein [Xylanibacter ruminicola]SHK71071.1 hypothetical protein SAMN05216463_11041 [Xylanibacter ruminicola]